MATGSQQFLSLMVLALALFAGHFVVLIIINFDVSDTVQCIIHHFVGSCKLSITIILRLSSNNNINTNNNNNVSKVILQTAASLSPSTVYKSAPSVWNLDPI